ncbi:MAG: hypothetical protein J7K75_02000 [Desulfuromonas sp.]|nr:hypothetical protein [Desulfuromonas sp.]
MRWLVDGVCPRWLLVDELDHNEARLYRFGVMWEMLAQPFNGGRWVVGFLAAVLLYSQNV